MADPSNGHDHKDHGVRPYIVVALILGVITYVEFAIIEFEVPFLGDAATLWWLMILSVAKFLMVILYFMHLKDDDASYSGFFASGMVIALGTFVAFTFLMTAPSSLSFVRAQLAPDGTFTHGQAAHESDDEHGLGEEVVALIDSDGYSRELTAVLSDGRPKDQRLAVAPPAAASEGWTLLAGAPAASADVGGAPAEAAPSADAADVADAGPAAQAEAGEWDQELGESVFASNCASCHQANGQGIPGAFPPLAGHAPELIAAEGGRTFMIDALLYGLQGAIQVGGTGYNGVMPAWGFLGDDEIAAVINHTLHAWDNAQALPDDFAPITADEIADERGQGLTGTDVHEIREGLDLP